MRGGGRGGWAATACRCGSRRKFSCSASRLPRTAEAYTTSTMAEIVLGIGTSHSPTLSIDYSDFPALAARDRGNPWIHDFDGMVREKASWIGRELRPDVTRARHEANQAALARLSAVLAEVAPDVVVVVGDDQHEWFSDDGQPAICIYWGESVENLPPPVEKMHPALRSG